MDRGEVRRAVLAYLAVPFTLFLVPLAVYLTSLGSRRFARAHAAVALSLSLATMLYTASILIVGGVLALDSASVGTLIAVPLLVLLLGRGAGRGGPRGWRGGPRRDVPAAPVAADDRRPAPLTRGLGVSRSARG